MSSAPPPRMSAPLEGPSSAPKRKTPTLLIIGIMLVGGCGVCAVLFAAILFPVFAEARKAAQSSRCMSNLRQIGISMEIYSGSNDDTLPIADKWMDAFSKAGGRPRQLHCPTVSNFRSSQYGFAFNKELSSKKTHQLDPSRELVFDSTLMSKNAVGSLSTLPLPGRHMRGGQTVNHILHMDGSVEARVAK